MKELFEIVKDVEFEVSQLNLEIYCELEKYYPDFTKSDFPYYQDGIELFDGVEWDLEILETKPEFDDYYIFIEDGYSSYNPTKILETEDYTFLQVDGDEVKWVICKNSQKKK